MTTHKLGTPEQVPSLPGELRPFAGHVPNKPEIPSVMLPSPGVTPGVLRVPGAPTVAEPDPMSLHLVVSQLANEAYGGPIAPPPSDPVPFPGGIASLGDVELPRQPLASPVPVAAVQNADPYWLSSAPTEVKAPGPAVPPASDRPSEPVGSVPASVSPTPVAAPAGEGISFERFTFSLDQDLPRPAERAAAGTPFDPHWIRRQFPILHQRVNGKPLVWLDNAATTQKPRAVIDRLTAYYERENSNVHRAAHTLAARSTDAYEGARETVRRTLNASSSQEVVFVRGATEGINLIAQTWGRRHVQPGDEIVISWLEHHANIVPWQRLCGERGARLRVAPVNDRGEILLEEYERLLTPRTRLVAFTQVSNALGTITPAQEMIALAHQHGARVLLDGAQGISHMPVDVQSLDCDFYVFSGHKVFGPTGIGAVYGRKDLLEGMPPWQSGGNMIQNVTFEETVYQPAPARFEAGTGSIADAVGLGAALEWLARVGVAQVARYEHDLLAYANERLAGVPGIRFIGTSEHKAGVISFVLANRKTEEVGGMLDQFGIAVRSGHHCAQPILRRFGVEATVRASLAPYNTQEDIDALADALRRIQLNPSSL